MRGGIGHLQHLSRNLVENSVFDSFFEAQKVELGLVSEILVRY